MGINEFIRLSRQASELRERYNLDAHTIDALSQYGSIIESIKHHYKNPNLSLDDLRLRINDIVAFGGLSRVSEIAASAKLENAGNSVFNSPIFDSVREANLSALNLAERFNQPSAIEEIQKIAGSQISSWTNFKDVYAPEMPMDKFLTSHLSQITQTSALAQSRLANIELAKIGGAFYVADDIKASFTNQFTDFSVSYKNLFKSFEAPETSLFRLPPSISELPTIEFFNGVDLLETTVEEENPDEFEDERIIVREEIRESLNDSVIIQLEEINEDWIAMLEGARQAFNSTNPDKTRHCITSLRELIREIMQYLSPDKEIKGWSKSSDDFYNNRPTRKARLRYITRNINHGAFTKFVEKDIEAILAAIDIFQAGTHVANSKLTDSQVAALIARVESTILFLFSIANYEE
jgi:hypothetical protein